MASETIKSANFSPQIFHYLARVFFCFHTNRSYFVTFDFVRLKLTASQRSSRNALICYLKQITQKKYDEK